MKTFVIPSRWTGYIAGWGNGYACIPPGHPCHGLSYDEIHDKYEIDINGGLTFSEPASGLENWPIPEDCKDCWIVGFDTAHYNDTPSKWPEDAVKVHAEYLASQLEKITA